LNGGRTAAKLDVMRTPGAVTDEKRALGPSGARGCAALLAGIGAALAVGAGPSSALSPLSFARPATYPLGDTPAAVAIGDLNRDGRPDLVSANEFGNSVSVLLNRGGGRFRTKRDYRTGGGPQAIAIGDLNGDGKLDVVTANDDADRVSVLLNRGGGTLGAKTDYPTGSGPLSVAIGDLNGDGKRDIATANFGDYTVSVLLNDGKGSFRPGGVYQIKEAWAVAISDLNGDGKADLAVTSVTGVSVLLNKGDGSFGTVRGYDTEARSYALAVGDLNRDGKADLVTANSDGDAVSVLLNKRDGTFSAARRFITGRGASSVAIADLNRDGKPDVLTAASRVDSVSVLLNRGAGNFGSRLDYRTGGSPGAVAAGDLNGDRRVDVITTTDGDVLDVLLNTTGAKPAPARRAAAGRARGTILFASNRTGNFEIYSVRADGSHLGQLTRNTAGDTRPAFSPDGRRIAFVRGYDLWLMNADGSRQRKLDRIEEGPAWSPDSRSIAYQASYRRSGDAYPIAVVNADGRRRVVVGAGRNHGPSWSPDGRRLVFAREVGDRTDVMVVGADGRGLRTLRRNASAPAWSPAGNAIAFAGKGLDVIRPDGSGARRVASSAAGFAWSPDGRRFAFGIAGRLFVVRAGGGAVRDITPEAVGRLSSWAWSPNGRWLVAGSVPLGVDTTDADLFVVAADGSSARRIAVGASYPFAAANGWASWRPRAATPARLGGRPVAPSPSEAVTAAGLQSVGAIRGLASDGRRVAVAVGATASDCAHISVWAPGSRPVHLGMQQPCSNDCACEMSGRIALAGARVAWTESSQGNTEFHVVLRTATTARPAAASGVASVSSYRDDEDGYFVGAELGALRGGGDLLVYNTWTDCYAKNPNCKSSGELWHDRYSVSNARLWRFDGSRPVEVRSGSSSFEAMDVDGGRVLVLEPGGPLDVVGAGGTLLHRLVLPGGLVQSAELSGVQVVILTATGLQAFDAATGAPGPTIPLARAERALVGFDQGIAVYVEGRVVHAVRLSDGHQTSLALPGKEDVFAQLAPAGLFTAYTLGRGRRPGRVDFMTRAKLERRLG
jgi:hypothetical protein